MKVLKRPRAKADLIHHYAFLFERNPDVAERFIRTAGQTFRKLAKMPKMGHIWLTEDIRLQGIRVWPLLPDFAKYLVFYRPLKIGIEILHVFHGSRDIASILESEED